MVGRKSGAFDTKTSGSLGGSDVEKTRVSVAFILATRSSTVTRSSIYGALEG